MSNIISLARKYEKQGFVVSESEVYPDTLYAMKDGEVIIVNPRCGLLNLHLSAIDTFCYELRKFGEVWRSVRT